MSNDSRFHVVEKASIRPDKIVFYNQFIRKDFRDAAEKVKLSPEVKKDLQKMGVPVKSQPDSNKHNFELSFKASSRIKEKVNWLYTLAKSKTVTPQSGKVLYSFKMNFITLTLPATQKHQTAEITSKCLNQFLVECSSKFGLKNYVWRLEFQKNGNAHYHIATDSFIDYWQAREVWNRCLSKLGYIDDYAKQFKGMTLAQYCNKYSQGGKIDFNTLKSRFTHGCATYWQKPNTVDIRAVSNAKNIAFYISKYITKKSEHTLNPVVSEREPSDSNLRLWFCSRSLSKLDKIEVFMDSFGTAVESVFSAVREVTKKLYDYCTVWYYSATKQPVDSKKALWLLFNEYGRERGYVPAT